MVITYSRLGVNRYGCRSRSWSAEQENDSFHFHSLRLRLRIWSRAIGSALPSHVSPLILHNQAESGACSRVSLLAPDFREGVHLYRQPSSGQCRVYRVTQLSTNGVHRLELLLLLLLFLTFSALVANPKKLLYTVANPARGLLNREKKKKKSLAAHPAPPARFGEKKKKKSRDAFTYLGATQVGVTQVVSVRLASVQGFLRLVS